MSEQERIAALTEALKECADELAEWVEEHYLVTLHHPSEKRRYDRDIDPVLRARALLAVLANEEHRGATCP